MAPKTRRMTPPFGIERRPWRPNRLLDAFWSPFGSLLAPFGLPLGSILGPWAPFGLLFASFWEPAGFILSSMAPLWDPFGLLGGFWEHFEMLLGTFWEVLVSMFD